MSSVEREAKIANTAIIATAGSGDGGGGAANPALDGLLGGKAAVNQLLDPAGMNTW
jgi:hypothetical protein